MASTGKFNREIRLKTPQTIVLTFCKSADKVYYNFTNPVSPSLIPRLSPSFPSHTASDGKLGEGLQATGSWVRAWEQG